MKRTKTVNQMIVAIDFDNTIVKSDYPGTGVIHLWAKDVINKWYAMGVYIIIWTCRTGQSEKDAEAFLLAEGVNFHKLNGHHPNGLLNYGTETQIEHGLESRKVWSHVLIDDTSIDWVLNGHPGWKCLERYMDLIIDKNSKTDNPWTCNN